MKIIDINAQALANTARECAQLANGVSGTIKWIVAHWNLCCQQAGMIQFTTEALYTRRAQLANEMLRIAEQLDRLAEGCHPITGQTAEEAHAEALEMNQILVDEAITAVNAAYDAANTDAVWRMLDAHPRSKPLIDNIEYHYVAMRNDAANGGDVTTAPQRLFGFNPGTTAEKAMRAVVGQAEEDFQAMIEADHVQALADDEARELVAAEQWDDWANAHDSRKTEAQMIESDHEEALKMNEGIDQAFRIIKALDGVHGSASGASACLMRDDYTDVAYLVSVASRMFGDYDEAHSEALEINQSVDRACLVIRAMRGADIEDVLSGIRGAMYQEGMNDIVELAEMAKRVEVTRAHDEALTIDAERQRKLEAIWRNTHHDYKGETGGVRKILVCRGATCLVPVMELTEHEIEQRAHLWNKG